MNNILVSIRSLLFFSLLLGGVYPMVVMVLGSVLSPIRSHGSLLKIGDTVIGSELIGQKFSQNKYFWPRPSAADYVPLNSMASQRSATDKQLKDDYLNRLKRSPGAPSDLLWASGSGLDPHISIASAQYQKPRVLSSRKISEEKLDEAIRNSTEDRFLGFMGQPRVNVLELNLYLDK